jgi:hypothetical protein
MMLFLEYLSNPRLKSSTLLRYSESRRQGLRLLTLATVTLTKLITSPKDLLSIPLFNARGATTLNTASVKKT